MAHSPDSSFVKHLDCIKDPRHHNTRHLLFDMLMVALCAIVSGADSWTQVSEYGRSKIHWFSQFLRLPNGIAPHDTFGRLFARLNPKGFREFFTRWVQDLSSLGNQACTIAKSIREHWGIENGLHWCLDISFREDQCRVRKDHAPENFAILRHMATNLLKREKSLKAGLQTKRLKAAWDHDYLLKVLTA